jgi:hypothetical protein
MPWVLNGCEIHDCNADMEITGDADRELKIYFSEVQSGLGQWGDDWQN